MIIVLECPIENLSAELTLECTASCKLRHEDLVIDDKVIAQLHDDNFWRISSKYNEWPEVDGWSHLTLRI